MFELKNISFGYTQNIILFSDVTLTLGKGEFMLLKGPSGSGKSSLLRLLNSLEISLKGEILFNDKPLGTYETTYLRRTVAFLQQVPVLLEGSVKFNLELPFTLRAAQSNKPSEEMLQRRLDAFMLEGVSLEDNAQNLSVGQKQRLALIRTLLMEPQVLLLDEPTASLDPKSKRIVEEQTERLNKDHGVTVMMVSHTDYIPKTIIPRILRLENGSFFEESR